MSNYHLVGTVNAILFTFALSGLGLQIRKIWRRRLAGIPRGSVTDVISVEYFFTSFTAIFATFIYSAATTRVNHYLIWPRSVGLLLILYILLEIFHDRRSVRAGVLAVTPCLVMLAGCYFMLFQRSELVAIQGIFQYSIAFMAIVISIGNASQIAELRKGNGVGAVSLALHSVYLVKDLSLCAFGFVLGTNEGWPFILFGGIDAAMKALILYYYLLASRHEKTIEADQLQASPATASEEASLPNRRFA